MDCKQTLDFIYKSCSQRIATRVKETRLTQNQIYPNDPKQISNIINNKRTANNRFLVCDAVMGNVSHLRSKRVGLIPMLRFQNEQEVLWGTLDERKAYLPQLFGVIMSDLLSHESELDFSISDVLCDFVPFAKYSAYWEVVFSNGNNIPALYFGITEDEILENIELSKENAVDFLYCKYKKEFFEIFTKFSEETKSFKKINMVFYENFIKGEFIPLIKKSAEDRKSLGQRVKNLILADLAYVPYLIASPNGNSTCDKDLIRASSEYILRLEEIQKNTYMM